VIPARRGAQVPGRNKYDKAHHNFGWGIVLADIVLVLLTCNGEVRAAAQTLASISKKELKTLLATARTSADQQRLAAYHRDKAQHLRAKAQGFSPQADYLATQPATIESKQGISCNCTRHCRYFSKLYAQEATGAETLAREHDQLAQAYKSKAAQQ
jgi:hypothetical protein